ncbi:hypothetical protein Rsub_09594 [Raphidocelis subcapitata]|uniref:Aminoglycoside phosphotransferase domain-containing protein n=1 Tax=Raphidocelis subcapitata TaxID=307507 RepID=A0A2V0PC48_9CHLO|nr:hypothetical protein Rsub_09594 [Raphidocelis subcapitata]|eukprot:GBF97428.1 hypothetical protein Rsub_09594 [Raphidocelis subcapitata]
MHSHSLRLRANGNLAYRAQRAPRLARVQAPKAGPATGHHTVSDSLRDEALAAFFDGPCTTAPTSGGVNNVCQYVTAADGSKWILRVYNNGGHTDKVDFEHAVLQQLGQQRLSFAVPRAKPSLRDGKPHVVLSSGDAACVFEIIQGDLAKTTAPREVGRATGELCTAMGRVDLGGREAQAPVPPYYDVFHVHHAMDRDLFYKQVAENPGFSVCRGSIDYLTEGVRRLEPLLAKGRDLGLPVQLIHGDLHYDNVMVLGDSVSGLLDFEFVAYDWRVMELAVALSKYVSEDDPLPLIREFVAGYIAGGGQVSDDEIELLPDCINLRMFSNTIYFTGRAYAGEDGLESLTSRADAYAKRVRWVEANRARMVETVRELARAPATAGAR